MIDASQVSAVLVTRGDVDLTEILASIEAAGIPETVVWNNAEGEDLQCFGRFAAIQGTTNPYIYVQDDDLIVPIRGLLAEYDLQTDAGTVVANKPDAEEWRFLGCGAVFNREVLPLLAAYAEMYGFDTEFCRVADVVFLYSLPYRSVDLGYRDLPWQTAPNRMYHQPGHYTVRERARERTLALVQIAA